MRAGPWKIPAAFFQGLEKRRRELFLKRTLQAEVASVLSRANKNK
jgi:hypothetical protein